MPCIRDRLLGRLFPPILSGSGLGRGFAIGHGRLVDRLFGRSPLRHGSVSGGLFGRCFGRLLLLSFDNRHGYKFGSIGETHKTHAHASASHDSDVAYALAYHESV